MRFQSTLPQGERPLAAVVSRSICAFQSTLPQGERLVLKFVSTFLWKISIHAPARGATGTTVLERIDNNISIHAPARGATTFNKLRSVPLDISIHAPARGATCPMRSPLLSFGHFNPRSRKGSDPGKMCHPHALRISIHAPARGATLCKVHNFSIVIISIHAPARGATFWRIPRRLIYFYFNPRSRKGSDDFTFADMDNISAFQSTLPQGERRYIVLSKA